MKIVNVLLNLSFKSAKERGNYCLFTDRQPYLHAIVFFLSVGNTQISARDHKVSHNFVL